MQEQQSAPITWLLHVGMALQWPVIVAAAFGLGRYVKDLEMRVITAEKNVRDLIERHMPHLHRALADLKGKLDTIQALLTKNR